MPARLQTIIAVLSLAAGAIAGGPADAVLAVHADMQKVPAELRSVTRWMYVGHLPDEVKQEQWQDVSGHVNSLSTARRILRPTVVLATQPQPGKPVGLQDADGLTVKPADWARAVLIRVQVDYYGENWKSWEKLTSPHFHANFVAPKFEKKIVKKIVQVEIGHYERRGTGQRVERAFARANPDLVLWIPTGTEPEEQSVEVLVPVKPDGKAVKGSSPILPTVEYLAIVAATQSEVPIVYADWFCWQTRIQSDRSPGYYDFLGVKDRKTFDSLVGFDKELFDKQFAAFATEFRWAVARSGVAGQPRRVATFDKIGSKAGYWITFDNRLAVGERNPLDTADDTFKHDAVEIFALLPSGMWATGLFNAKDERQDSAPDFIGHDRLSTENRARIEVGLSCFRCHTNGGLQDLRDYYARTYRPPVAISDPDYKKIKRVQEQYFSRVQESLEPARAIYARALWEATGLTPEKYATVLGKRWYEYADSGVDFARACRELGTTPELFWPKLRAYCEKPGQGQTVLSQWYEKENHGEKVEIDNWHERFSLAAIVAAAKP